MKKIIFILLFSTLHNMLFSQTAVKTSSKTPAKSEIDKLAEKYKDVWEITLFTSHGDLKGDVIIENNSDKKPQSVNISGESTNADAVAEFLSQIIAQKRKQGYKTSDGNYEPTDANWIKETKLGFENGVNYILKKDKMYFICKGGYVSNLKYADSSKYWFSIETGDNSRKGGTKATKFEF